MSSRLAQALALACGPAVRVNTLMAGPFCTDISRALGGWCRTGFVG